MKITKSNLSKLETEYKGYLEGETLLKFMEEFDIKFAAGHWCAGDFMDRFATNGYFPNIASDVHSQLERIHRAKIKGVELQDFLFLDERQEISEDKINDVKATLEKLNLRVSCMSTNLFTDPTWQLGSITHPDSKIRERAVGRLLQAAEIAKELECPTLNFWPGQDGWDYNFESDYGKKYEWFVENCAEVAKKCDKLGLKFSIESKPKEPKEGNMIVPTTHLSGWIAHDINNRLGKKIMGVTIDYGHEMMYGVEPAFTVYVLHRMGVPINGFHINAAKYRSNDEDRLFGTGDVWGFVDYLYSAVDTGYDGWFTEDQFTYRMDPVSAMHLSMEIFANLMKKALLLYAKRDELEETRSTGDQVKIINLVKKIIF
ncbi:MAG: sugar phosphate isomerase/epimerase family protein [Candidatus Korarchaeota archaeon]